MGVSNSWNETIADVNKTLAEMNSAISNANGAAESAREEAESAGSYADEAEKVIADAASAIEAASSEANKWRGATVSANTLEPSSDATVSISEKNGVKHITFGIPRGVDGKTGDKGDIGNSGVTFSRSGTTLYITTNR